MSMPGSKIGSVIVMGAVCSVFFCPPTVQAQAKLEYKFPEGKKLTYKTTSRARQVLNISGTNLEVIRREMKVWSRSVGKRKEDSTLPIEEKVDSLRVEYTFPGETKLVFDSSKPEIKIDDPQLAFLGDIFKLESEISFTVLLDDQKKLKAIEGTEKLKQRAEKLSDPIARAEIYEELTAERLKRKFEQMLRRLPDVPARTGEPWERSETLEINGKTFTTRKKYEYQGTEKKGDKTLDKISCKTLEVKYDQDPKSKLPLKVDKSNLKVDSSEGTILFNRDEGLLVSATEKIRMKGNMTYLGGGGTQGGGFDLAYDSNTQLEPAAK